MDQVTGSPFCSGLAFWSASCGFQFTETLATLRSNSFLLICVDVIADATTGDVAATITIIAAGTLTQTIPKTGIPVSKFTNAGMLMASAQDAT